MKEVKVIFIDLDGTLIQTKSGNTFPVNNDDWKIIDSVWRVLPLMLRQFDHIMIVTNQGGFRNDPVRLTQQFKRFKLSKIESLLVSTIHAPGKFLPSIIAPDFKSPYRKPRIGWVEDYFSKRGMIVSKDSVMIGDAGGREGDFSDSDLKFASNLGINFLHAKDI